MRRLVFAVLAGALIAAPAASAKSPPFVGVWKGTVKIAATGAMSPVVITLTTKLKSNNSGTIVYSSPRCTGKLAFLKQSGRVLTLRESILAGPCAKGGSIALTQWDFRTLWAAWYGVGAADPVWSGYVLLGGRWALAQGGRR